MNAPSLSIVQARIILRGTHPIKIIREAWKMQTASAHDKVETISLGPERSTVHIRFVANHQHWLPDSHLACLAENIIYTNV